jgi:hypothetical protein
MNHSLAVKVKENEEEAPLEKSRFFGDPGAGREELSLKIALRFKFTAIQ